LSAADIVGGVEYSDATLTDGDARFVFNLIDSATQGGCVAVNYLAVKGLQFGKDNDWTVKLFDGVKRQALSLKARVLVNAAGPFADSINQLAGVRTRHRHVYSKGIHLVVKRVSQGSRVLSFFADDGRPLFVIPTGDRSSLGTTDTPVDQPDTHVTERDRRFVLDNINRALGTPGKFTPADVISERCGVRALAVSGVVDEGQDFLQLSRRHTVEVDRAHGMVTIFGGKLTSCLSVGRKIKTHVLALLDRMNEGQREDGFGESGTRARDEFLRCATRIFEADAHLVDVAKRLWRYYGEGANQILAAIQLDPSRAAFILPEYGVTRAELEFVQATQMVVTLDDYLRRRTLLAVTTRKEDLAVLAGMMEVCRILFGDRAKIEYEKTFSL
jgi:glycerol-3-phosphate dehydrogenase